VITVVGVKMLSDEDRKQTVDYVVSKVMEKGVLASNSKSVKRYNFGLPFCSLSVIGSFQPSMIPYIEIAENFGDPAFVPTNWLDTAFDGIRTLYRGGRDGLDQIVLQGIYAPDADGAILLPAEKLLRSNELADRKVTVQDISRFDAFLQYAKKEL
jgi:hypothetical protein